MTSSLSITLQKHGTSTKLTLINESCDKIILNNHAISHDSSFFQKTKHFIDLFRYDNECFLIETNNNIPTAAGLASSASGFAALTLALDAIYDLTLPLTTLSMIARRGSGSACRSFWPGFVYWEKGQKTDGTDSYASPLDYTWPSLCIGLNLIESTEKPISSREAMNITTKTSPFYALWPALVKTDLKNIISAIADKDFLRFGEIIERNAIAMHATMQTAWPPIFYHKPKTLQEMQKIWDLRTSGIPVFFTQDAGPNLKLVFLEQDKVQILEKFPELKIISC